MRQGLGAPKGKWQGNPQGGVATPAAIILPDPATRFIRTADRLDMLATGHPMQDWLRLMAILRAPSTPPRRPWTAFAGTRADGGEG